MHKRRALAPLFLLSLVLVLTGGEVIDRIAAVVNDDVILLSEVDEKLFIVAAQGQLQGRDSTEVAQVRRDILDRLIEERLVVQRAKSQGIRVDDSEIVARVDEAMTKVKSQFPTTADFERALQSEGLTETMLRERYENDVRQEFLAQRIVGREIRGKVEVTSDQVKKFYDENQDQLPPKPDELEMAHLVCFPISPEKDKAARAKIEAAAKRLATGESFEDVAKAMSEDPTSARGGLLGWFGPGDLDPDFQATVDTLDTMQISEPIQTRFGYHIVQVLDRNDDRFQVRHILVLVEPSGEELARAYERAQAAHDRLEAGAEWATVVREASDDEFTRDDGGNLGWTSSETLLPDVAAVLDSLTVGDYSDLVQTEPGYHVFKLLNRRGGEAYTYDEIRDRLRQLVENQELQKVYDEWMAGIRDSAYVEIKAWNR